MDISGMTISKAHKGLIEKEFSAKELAESFLKRIEKEDKKISAFVSICEDSAIESAKKADEIISKESNPDLLCGIPFAVKDNILVEGIKTTCSSKMLENYISPYNATCIKKIKEKGAVILGKTNMDEFAMGASTENSAFFTTKNPKDLKRVPGGSSGGSAAAVADDMCCCALGSDTGGSIRQPASFCGVFGLKPTYGAVSRYGLVAFASSLDQIGPLAKTAKDAKIIFNHIFGKDPLDATSVDFKPLNYARDKEIVAGIPKEYFVSGIDEETKKAVDQTIKKYQELGIKIEEISLPHTEYAIPTYYLICMSEVSANLARYDGIKYGLSSAKAKDLLNVYLESREEGIGKEVKRRIMMGTFALSSGYYDAYYLKAQKVRALIKNDFHEAFKKVDVIFSPTSPTTAFKIGDKIEDHLAMYLCDIYTAPVNLAGLPAISVPVGSGKLPVGFQIIGRPFEEEKILDLADSLNLE
jgi:aspartyl-tRNA(Asn)/glutamyl-tRNA(Gln) amidotransferase subunit A